LCNAFNCGFLYGRHAAISRPRTEPKTHLTFKIKDRNKNLTLKDRTMD